MEGEKIPILGGARCIRVGDDGKEIARCHSDGHDDGRDERGRDRRVDSVAARGQHTQPGGRDEGAARR